METVNQTDLYRVPEEVEKAINVVLNHIYMEGWGGAEGDDFWSLKGIGPVLPLLKKIAAHKKSRLGYRKHIRMLERELQSHKTTTNNNNKQQ